MDVDPESRGAGLGPDPDTVGEVLVMRPGGLAEMVRAVPALRHLRATYPSARVTVLARAEAVDLIGGCPYVDSCLELERAAEVLLARFDVAISFATPEIARPNVRRRPSALLGRFPALADINAGTRAAYREQSHASEHVVHPVWPVRLGDAARMLRLVWLLGGANADPTLSLWPTLADRNSAAQLVAGVERPIALVHPFAHGAPRRWPMERYAVVCDALDRLGMQPVVIGVEEDRPALEVLRRATSSLIVDLAGLASVGVLAGLMERASLFVGNDSGPAALAAALDLHSIVVAPATAVEQSGTAGRVSHVTVGGRDADGSLPGGLDLADAVDVPLEPVLACVSVAAHQAVLRWQAARVA